jgi:uncharacterized Rmd1/YagE family protein
MSENVGTKSEAEKIFVKAYDVASLFQLHNLRKEFRQDSSVKVLEGNPLLIQSTSRRTIVIFDYGAVVFFDYPDPERREIIEKIKLFAERVNAVVNEDDFTLTLAHVTKAPEGTDELIIKEFNRDIALVISTVLSRSVSVEFYETLVRDALAQLEAPIASLQSTGKIPHRARELTKRVGFALAVEQELAHTLSAFDDPEIVWDGGKRIEELYTSLKRQFDLDDRIKIIQQKVSIISRSTTFIISRLEARRSQFLEWIIIILILLEIVLFATGKI